MKTRLEITRCFICFIDDFHLLPGLLDRPHQTPDSGRFPQASGKQGGIAVPHMKLIPASGELRARQVEPVR